MTKRAIQEIEIEKFLDQTWKELKRDFRGMVNWLLFYKPKDRIDKLLHIIEVIFVWGIVSRLF